MFKRILIISPHPDDESVNSGGLIVLAKKKGWEVFVIYVSTGSSRQFTNGHTDEKDRLNEAEEASILGNFEYEIGFMGTSTKLPELVSQKQIIELIENRVKKFKPDIVVIPYRQSYSQDHRAVAEACISAFRPIPNDLHPQPKYILETEEICRWPVASNPNFFIDITDVIEDKLKLYACHKTQIVKPLHYRSFDNVKRLAGLRGAEIGVEYAEAYTMLRGQL